MARKSHSETPADDVSTLPPAAPDDTTGPDVGAEPEAAPVSAPLVADPGDVLGAAPVMPDVQEGAVDAARESAQATTAAAPAQDGSGAPVKGQTDFKGRHFDPILHETDADGKAKINGDGFVKCRRGTPKVAPGQPRPSRSRVSPKDVKGQPGQPGKTVSDPEPAIQATAQTTTALVFAMGQLVGGPEFAPEAGENDAITGAFAGYYRAKGISDIPPGAALSITLAAYVIKRWNKPVFKERREGWWSKARRWWSDFRLRRQIASEADLKEAERA